MLFRSGTEGGVARWRGRELETEGGVEREGVAGEMALLLLSKR